MNKELIVYHQLIEFLGKTLGEFYTLSLYEITDEQINLISKVNLPENYIEKIEKYIKSNLKKDSILNKVIELETNKLDKISLFPIKDESEKIIGCLCITMKSTPFLKLDTLVHAFLNFENSNNESDKKEYPLTFDGIDQFFLDNGYANEKPNKNERIDIVCDLYDLGMFNIKGAIEYVAEKLHTSSKTIYRYISTIKESRD